MLKQLSRDAVTDIIEPDRRGCHENHPNASERETLVIDHICLFKVVESHYARENVKSPFLPESLSVTEMHRMYIKWCSKNYHKAEDNKFYYRVFTEQFDLKFQKPKKDQFDQCTAFNNKAIVNRMPGIVENNKHHIAEKIAARAYKNKLKAETEGSTNTSRSI